jgi:hypothetical protein
MTQERRLREVTASHPINRHPDEDQDPVYRAPPLKNPENSSRKKTPRLSNWALIFIRVTVYGWMLDTHLSPDLFRGLPDRENFKQS